MGKIYILEDLKNNQILYFKTLKALCDHLGANYKGILKKMRDKPYTTYQGRYTIKKKYFEA